MALGSTLDRAEKKCLLIDLDPQRHSTLGLGVELNDGDPTLREIFTEPPQDLSFRPRVRQPCLDPLPDQFSLIFCHTCEDVPEGPTLRRRRVHVRLGRTHHIDAPAEQFIDHLDQVR